MRILKKNLKEGYVDLLIDSGEDLWYVHEILAAGDRIRGTATRKIKVGDNQDTAVKKKFTVTITLTNQEYEGTVLKLNGVIREAPEDIPKGAHQNITLSVGEKISIMKEEWDSLERAKLDEAQRKHHDALVVLVDRNDAVLALLKKQGYQIVLRARGESHGKQYETQAKDFFKEVCEHIFNAVNTYTITTVIVGASTFWHDTLKEYLRELHATKTQLIVVSYANSGKEKDLEALFTRKELAKILEEDKTAQEIILVENALERLARRDKISYGLKEVRAAAELGAVASVLVSEQLIKELRAKERQAELERVLATVESMKGTIHIISPTHDAGKRLRSLGGIIALLRYEI